MAGAIDPNAVLNRFFTRLIYAHPDLPIQSIRMPEGDWVSVHGTTCFSLLEVIRETGGNPRELWVSIDMDDYQRICRITGRLS